jgi:hypothetical protein
VHAEERNKNKKCMLKEGIFSLYFLFFSFLQHVLLVFIPSFSMHFLFLIRPSVYASCLYSFLQEGIKTRSTSWRKEYKQEAYTEGRIKNKKCMLKEGLYSFLQHVLLVFYPSFSLYFLLLFLPSACTSCLYRNTNKNYKLKEGIKTRSTCWRKE